MSVASPIDAVLERLPDARKVGADGWIARCPSHHDEHPSLSVSTGEGGKVLLICRAGCKTQAVVDALGLAMTSLFPKAERLAPDRRTMTAAYDYRDEQGELLYQVCRFEPKDFRPRRPVSDGWVWNLTGVRRVLYRLPDLPASDPREPVLVPEGEKDVDRLRGLGFVATTNPGGAGKWRPEYGSRLAGRHVVILPDNDDPGRNHAKAVMGALRSVATAVLIIELPGLPPKGDVSDWLDAGGTADELRSLIAASSLPAPAAPVEAFAVQPPAMNLAETLDAVVTHLTRFVHFAAPEHAQAVALWAAHSHVPLERLEQSPILALTSAVKQSGKTKLLDVLEFLVRDPWRITRPSES
ncbi:MAG TPA: hypothetical protein VIK13_04760, partial [Candidatus Limnocylindrales bacterium]